MGILCSVRQASGLFSAAAAGIQGAGRARGRDLDAVGPTDDDNADATLEPAGPTRETVSYDDL